MLESGKLLDIEDMSINAKIKMYKNYPFSSDKVKIVRSGSNCIFHN